MKHLRLKLLLLFSLLPFIPGGGLSVFAQTADGPVLADTVVTYGTRGEKIVEYIMLPAPLVRDDRKAPDERFLGNGADTARVRQPQPPVRVLDTGAAVGSIPFNETFTPTGSY